MIYFQCTCVAFDRKGCHHQVMDNNYDRAFLFVMHLLTSARDLKDHRKEFHSSRGFVLWATRCGHSGLVGVVFSKISRFLFF